MASFLEKTANHLIDRYGSDLSEIYIVLPNRRAGLFLRKFFALRISKPVWSPLFFSIEDFMTLLSGLKEAEPVFLLLELYEIHKVLEREEAQPFEEFLSWGPQLIADFNEIDRHLADARYLFSYLDEVKAINLWNPDQAPLSDFQKKYLKFYQSLFEYYNRLSECFIARGEGYQGLIFRQACHRLDQQLIHLPCKKIIFAGFNALTAAEEKIMQHFYQEGQAELLFDADHYYVDAREQEAGDFLRKWFSQWPLQEKNWISEDYLNAGKIIEIIGVADIIGQVKYCGELLKENEFLTGEQTAIVLADENLLLPLLNSLPESVENLNITMGLPLKQTPLADLLDLVFQMHLHAHEINQNKSGLSSFYYRDVLSILLHPYTSRIAARHTDGNQFIVEDLCARINSGKQVFFRKSDLLGNGLFDLEIGFFDAFFSSWQEFSDALHDLRKVVDLVLSTVNGGDNFPVEAEYAYALARLLHQMTEMLRQYPLSFSWQTLYKFFRQQVESITLPFYGEPLKGIQIMGMLETRTLDFDHVILLSCNEGMLPSARAMQSFIPFDIKREFGLPTYIHKDAVYSYHFYRLLQRAKKVWLLYSTDAEPLGGGEKSRFIRQICHELPSYNPSISIRERILNSPLPKGMASPVITIMKEGNVLEMMFKKSELGFSPSSLNAYRKCSLRFYFSEIAGLRERETTTDEIDSRTLGSIVHLVLYQLYHPYQNQVLSEKDFTAMMRMTDECVRKAFTNFLNGSAITYGKNYLLVQVASIMIRNFLKTEIMRMQAFSNSSRSLTVKFLEHHLRKNISVCSEKKMMEIVVKGVIDRIDHDGSGLRVLDYKTGISEKKELMISSWEDLLHDPKLDKGFQLLTYAWLLSGRQPRVAVSAGIFSLRKPGDGAMMVQVPGEEDGNSVELLGVMELLNFENVLKDLITEIYDIHLPFIQTEDRERCRYCPYLNICGR